MMISNTTPGSNQILQDRLETIHLPGSLSIPSSTVKSMMNNTITTEMLKTKLSDISIK